MEGLVLSENRIFLLCDDLGDVPAGDTRGFGMYYLDTRFMSALQLEINGFRPELLTSSAEHNYLSNIQLTNPAFLLPDGKPVAPQTISIRRNRFIDGALEERIGLFNYNRFPIPIKLSLIYSADFRDMFDVRGYYRAERGEVLDPTCDGQPFSPQSTSDIISLNYLGRDGVPRRTDLTFEQLPDERELIPGGQLRVAAAALKLPELKPVPPELGPMPPGVRVRYRLVLEPQRPYSITYYAVPVVSERSPKRPRARFDIAAAEIRRSYEEDWLAECTSIRTSNEVFNQMIYRGQIDVRALLATYDVGGRSTPFPFAGIPWYSAPFGRDALITGDQTLILNPEVAVGTLRFLAAHQGTEVNDWRDEQPGKILHEIRYGEFVNRGRVPHSPYYGTVDATPLFLVLFCKVMDWLDDGALYEELLPSVERALEWIRRYGELEWLRSYRAEWSDWQGEGLIWYLKLSPEGLRNQAWKDSGDSYQFPDGSLADPPIASIEVQGYVYDAKVRLARLFRRKGRADQAEQLEREAEQLRRAIDERFWMPDEEFYAQALDHRKIQVPSVTSNPGHLLWSGTLTPERAELVARRLLADDMFSGWGIRTLSSVSPNFNPMAYHNGTVWPHDNSLIVAGLRRYGYDELATTVMEGIFLAGEHFRYFRLPELYCGFTRDVRYRATPAEYPVSCTPQSWAAGSAILFVKAILGLEAKAWATRLQLRPRLPGWLREIAIRNLRIGNARVDFVVDHQGVRDVSVRGEPELEVVSQ